MTGVVFRAWHLKENRMYYRAYQKLFYVLLCEEDGGESGGPGRPALRASYTDCVLMQSSGLRDRNGREIFEGDRLRIRAQGASFEGVLEEIPDMYKSRRLHPLDSLLKAHGIADAPPDIEIEVTGNAYENP